MATITTGFDVRLGVRDAETVRRALQGLGGDGEAALRKLERAANRADSQGFKALNAGLRDASGLAQSMAGRLGPLGAVLGRLGPAGLAAAAGIAALSTAVIAGIKAAEEEERVFRRLDLVLRSTGNTTALSSRQIKAFAAEVGAATGRASEEIIASATSLATYTTIAGDEFRRTIALAGDMATVFGGALKENVDRLARALDDPIEGFTALRRVGFALEQSELDLVEAFVAAGDAAGAQRVILDNLQKQIGGAAAAEQAGLTGAVTGLGNAWDDLLKSMGSNDWLNTNVEIALRRITGYIDAATGAVDRLNGGSGPEADRRRILDEASAIRSGEVPFSFSRGSATDRLKELQDELRKIDDLIEREARREEAARNRAVDAAARAKEARAAEIELERLKEEREEKAKEAAKLAEAAEKERIKRLQQAQIETLKSVEAEAEARQALDDYVAGLTEERTALTLSAREQFIRNKLLAAEKLLTEASVDDIEARREEIEREAGALYDVTKAQEAARKAREDARRAREREAERAAKEMQKPFENALEGIQDSFTDFFQDVFSGGVDSFRDLAGGIKQIFIRLAAELAALMVIRPVLSGIGLGGILGGAAGIGGGGFGGVGGAGGGLNFASLGGDLFSLGRTLAGGAGIGSFLFGGSPLTGAGGLLTGGGVTSSGIGAVTPGLFGTGSSFLASSGLGILGSVLPGLISGNYAQAGLGGLGALAGSFIAPGIGTVLGGLFGNLLGGLFGGKKKTPQAVTNITAGAAGAGVGGNVIRAGGNVGATTSLAGDIAAAVNGVVEALGGSLTNQALGGYILTSTGKNQGTVFLGGTGQYGKGNSIDKTLGAGFGSSIAKDAGAVAEAVAVAIIRENAKKGAIEGLSATESTVLSKTKATDLTALNADLTFAQLYEQLVGLVDETTDYQKAVEALTKSYTDASAEAKRLGLDVDILGVKQAEAIAKLTTDFNASIQDQILGLTNPAALALRELERAQEKRLDEARAAGADLVAIERLSALERAQVLKQSLGGLQSLFDELTFGALGGASPADALAGARASFEAAAAQGDVAGIQQYGGAFASLSRQFNASGEGFQTDRERILSVLGQQLDPAANSNFAAANQTALATTETSAVVKSLLKVQEDLLRTNTAMAQEMAQLRVTSQQQLAAAAQQNAQMARIVNAPNPNPERRGGGGRN